MFIQMFVVLSCSQDGCLVVAVCPLPPHKCVKMPCSAAAAGLGGGLSAGQSRPLFPGSPTWTPFTPSAVPQHQKTDNGSRSSNWADVLGDEVGF